MEEMQARQRKEQKDLQGRITQKKKNATKKTRKGINDECDRLERELKERQRAELDALDGANLETDLGQLQLDDPGSVATGNEPSKPEPETFASPSLSEGQQQQLDESQRGKKPNRQKVRLARRAAEQEAQATAAAEEAANQPDLREQEMTAMKQHKEKLGLSEILIRPDGHCLFSACANGLSEDVVKGSGPHSQGYQNVRYATADFMSKHRNDFEAFLEEPFDGYVNKIKNTAEWGGQLELQAIAQSYQVTVNVLQADGRVEKFQPAKDVTDDKEIWLAYYRHSFGLGEHYNALSKT